MTRADPFLSLCFAMTVPYCSNLVPLLLVGWQSPPCKLTIASEYSAGMKPLTAFRASINSISIRNNIFLITPIVHILSHRRRSVLDQLDRLHFLKVHFGIFFIRSPTLSIRHHDRHSGLPDMLSVINYLLKDILETLIKTGEK